MIKTIPQILMIFANSINHRIAEATYLTLCPIVDHSILQLLFKPVRSPQSNGVAEVLV